MIVKIVVGTAGDGRVDYLNEDRKQHAIKKRVRGILEYSCVGYPQEKLAEMLLRNEFVASWKIGELVTLRKRQQTNYQKTF